MLTSGTYNIFADLSKGGTVLGCIQRGAGVCLIRSRIHRFCYIVTGGLVIILEYWVVLMQERQHTAVIWKNPFNLGEEREDIDGGYLIICAVLGDAEYEST